MSPARGLAAYVSLGVLAAIGIAAAQTPAAVAQGVATPGVATPGVATPGVAALGAAATPAVATPGVATPGVATLGAATPAVATPRVTTPGAATPGVTNPQRAWQNWTLNCQGCHRQDGTGSAGTAPSLAGTVARFLTVPGGREYLGRVPGVATSPLANEPLAEVMNWMFWRFDREHVPTDFQPFTAEEIGGLRGRPLRLEASQMRIDLLQRAAAGD